MVTSSSDYGFGAKDADGLDTRTTFSYPMFQQFVADNRTMTDLVACAPSAPSTSSWTAWPISAGRSSRRATTIAAGAPLRQRQLDQHLRPGTHLRTGPARQHQPPRGVANFFSTMEIPLIAGRAFTPQDVDAAPRVAIVNEAAVRKYFP
jgi:hypothetical protein